MMRTADTDHTAADSKTAASTGSLVATAQRIRLSRAPGILFLTAALMLPISGAMAFDLDAPATLPPEPDVAAPAEDALTTPAAPTTTPSAADDALPATTARHPGVVTGDLVDDAEREAFLQWVAAQQADGKHRGIAVYTSW